MKENKRPALSELAIDAQAFIIASRPILDYTPHIYISALPFAAPFGSISSYYLPRFKGFVKASGTIVEKIQHAELRVRESSSPILCAAFSPKDDFIVLGNEEGEIWAQNVYDKNYVFQPFIAHMKPINCVAISCDSRWIVAGSHDKTLSIWNSKNGSPMSDPFRGHKKAVISVALSPSSTHIASGSNDHTIGIWVSQNSTIPMKQLLGHTKPVKSVAFLLDGKHVISGSFDHTVRLWDISSEATIRILQGHTSPVILVAPFPNGVEFFSGSEDTTIRTWKIPNGSQHDQPPKIHSFKTTVLAVSPEGDRIAFDSPDDFSIRVLCRNTGRLTAGPFEGHTASIRSIGFSGDGMRVITTADDKTMRIWNVRTRAQQVTRGTNTPFTEPKYLDLGRPVYPGGPILMHSPQQTSVATSYGDLVHIWNLQTTARAKIHGTPLFLQYSADDSHILCLHDSDMLSGDDYKITQWNTNKSTFVENPRYCSVPPSCGRVWAWSVDGTRLLTINRATRMLDLWDVQSMKVIASCGDARSTKVIFSLEGGNFLTSTANDKGQLGSITIWWANSGGLMAGPFPGNTALDFSPNGIYIVCRSNVGLTDNELRMININDGTNISMPFNYRPGIRNSFSAEWFQAKFSLDSLYVTCVDGGWCYIWNIRGETVVNTALTSPNAIFRSISCSRDGLCLASSTRDLKRKKIFRVGWFRFNDLKLTPVAIAVQPDGWVLDDLSRPLFWVPTEIREELSLGNGLSLNTENGDWLCVNSNDILVGDDWSKCYVVD
ncbi:hypothetical protein RSOLAG1IB_04357 [Rhizoctonia solani AG-1 IB]|uniref:Uncharacterized protein n=1 Tax=Thanatephorus cucumeris (strain AG1-IB / isolate 7/3/14) TaxID=1108050 RepID=A0A0B7FZL5_THACB|nr:hypothetical protein RSOLAG1IB_04357 [Rhizoctonia solani AG-1 IB]